jgi:uncharacterized damage-inducible protein DinB
MATQTETEIQSMISIIGATRKLYEMAKVDVLAAAEAMPETAYSFKTQSDVRTFGQQVAHIADANYLFASSCLAESNPFPGVTPTESGVLEKTRNGKSEIVEALKSSFAFCDRAFDACSDSNANEMVAFRAGPRANTVTKAYLLNVGLYHIAVHYGAMTHYLRLKGLVPPSTQRFKNSD